MKKSEAINPFLFTFNLNVVQHTYVSNDKSAKEGSALKTTKQVSYKYVEQQEKTSVYDIQMIEVILYKNMYASGRDLFLYIMYNMVKNKDYIKLEPEKVIRLLDITRNTYYSAIGQLMTAGVICKKSNSHYWVNPAYLFKGNRMNHYDDKYPSCIKVINTPNKTEQ